MPSELQSLRIPDALLEQIDRRTRQGAGRADTIREQLQEYFGLQTEFAPELLPRLARGGPYESPLGVLRRDLERYYESLARARRGGRSGPGLRGHFTGDEQALMCDVLNGTLFADTAAPGEVWQEIEDAVRHDDYAEKWKVDGAALVAKLRDLTYTQNLALVDAVERFWSANGRGEAPDPRRILEEVR